MALRPDRAAFVVECFVLDTNKNPVAHANLKLLHRRNGNTHELFFPTCNDAGRTGKKVDRKIFSILAANDALDANLTLMGKKLKLVRMVQLDRSARNVKFELVVELPEKPVQKLPVELTVTNQMGRPVVGAVPTIFFMRDERRLAFDMPKTDMGGLARAHVPETQFAAIRKGYAGPPKIVLGDTPMRVLKSSRLTDIARGFEIEVMVHMPGKDDVPSEEDRPDVLPEKLPILVNVFDQNTQAVSRAVVTLKYKWQRQTMSFSLPQTDDDGRAEFYLAQAQFNMVRRGYLDPPQVFLNEASLQIIGSRTSTDSAKALEVYLRVYIPAQDNTDPSPLDEDVTPDVDEDVEDPELDDDDTDLDTPDDDAEEDKPPSDDDGLPWPEEDDDDTPSDPRPDTFETTELTMNDNLPKRLFRFNTIRPVAPQPDAKKIIEYSGEPTEFLKTLQSREDAAAVRSFVADEVYKYEFFQEGRLENIEWWPLIAGIRDLYLFEKKRNVEDVQEKLLEAFARYGKKEEIKALAGRIHDIWDLYILSLTLQTVEDTKRNALVDALKAAHLIENANKIETLKALLVFLTKKPVLPPWLARKITGQFRHKFPFVIGVTDLMVVKEDWKCYERAEIAHIENVMDTEHRTRTLRQLDRKETTTTYETETTEETEKETIASTHSAVSEEIEETIARETGVSAGVSVSASYGPSVKVDTNSSFDFTTATETTTNSAQEYAQDLVERAVAKVTNRERNETVTVVLSETEQTHVQIYDNVEGPEHVIGVYRHLDQIWRAQVFNYGRRLMLDFVVPEPAALWHLSLEEKAHPHKVMEKPDEFNVSSKSIQRNTYQDLARDWGANNVPAPPPENISVSKAIELEIPKFGTAETSSISMNTGEMEIPEGYFGVKAFGNFYGDSKKDNSSGSKDAAKWLVNGDELAVDSGTKEAPLNNATGIFAFGIYTDNFEGGVLSVKVDCVLSQGTFEKWQNDVYAALKAANDRAWDAYNSAQKNREALQLVEQQTLHPDIKRQIEKTELKRSVISLLREDNYEENGSVVRTSAGSFDFPHIRFDEAKKEGRVARFFEEAFEWSEMTYLYYPYFWGRRSEWYRMIASKDPDFNFNAFLQAGSARVNLAIRPGFEEAVLWFMATGEVWRGGPTPMVGDPMYVALIDEIVESKGRDLDNPTAVGDSWTYSIPTSLVVLDKDDSLIPPSETRQE